MEISQLLLALLTHGKNVFHFNAFTLKVKITLKYRERWEANTSH